jgi:hypothetical protein
MPEIDARLIRNVLGALNGFDYGDVDPSLLDYAAWQRFSADPARIFPKLKDHQQDAIAALISRRLTKEVA